MRKKQIVCQHWWMLADFLFSVIYMVTVTLVIQQLTTPNSFMTASQIKTMITVRRNPDHPNLSDVQNMRM